MQPEPQRLVDRREFPVLYVDDERANLRAFELAFRRDFTIYTAESGADALDLINQHPISVVLSDHRMPEMTGTDFLSRVREVDPRTVRLLVTAYGDAETLADAVNHGKIYRYIPKPWSPDQMRQVVVQAIDLYALESEKDSLLRELTAVRSISHQIGSESDLDRLTKLVVRAVASDLGFDAAMIGILDKAGVRLTMVASSESSDPDGGLACELSIDEANGGPWLESVRSGETKLVVAETATELGPVGRTLAVELAAEEILSVPLVGPRGAVGVLVVDNRKGGRSFRAAERALLEGLASQVSLAIENARSMEPAESVSVEVDQLKVLAAPALLLASGFRPARVLEDLIAEVRSDRIEACTLCDLSELLSEAAEGIAAAVGRAGVSIATDVESGKVSGPRSRLTLCLALLLVLCVGLARRGGTIGVTIAGGRVALVVPLDPGVAPDLVASRVMESLELAAASELGAGFFGPLSVGPLNPAGEELRVSVSIG